ncbi:sulfurtransferase [Oceanicoccus sagamiensis]|uniref:Sulfurtransferase n=1 Tax=Oceanicoccus sagamiensis TaxID=716816 RepID=A0A1X9NE28_9GAMM|nr:sulfurtransferase [Oceanicoccus sagamiensis]ARN73207.1 sulfurtransferase [Oceanicoccus sagamiensis]
MSSWLITAAELAERIQQPNIVVVDCRFSLADTEEGERLYRQGHIEGAYYLHLDHHLSGNKARHGGRHPLPEVAVFAATLEQIGISNNTLVVAYDNHRFAFASRLWWLLRYVGHSQVKVLDGGFNTWCEQGLPVTKETPTAVEKSVFTPQVDHSMTVDIDQVKTIADKHHAALIDSRERERYLGEQEPIDPVAGHIAGADNFPWSEVTDKTGCYAANQQQRWGSTVDKDELVVYCGSGVTACVNLLSLAELGREDAKLYPGSWSDWCSYL